MIDIDKVNFDKSGGIIPAIIQDGNTRRVLMMGYMSRESLKITLESGRVTFFSRTRNRLWTKGEESGNFLEVGSVKLDCDHDTLLITAHPSGPVCHTGADTCWDEKNAIRGTDFLFHLESVISSRKEQRHGTSYTASLFESGINRIAQKVGEEAVELIIEAKDDHPELFLGEAADLVYHLLVLLQEKGYRLSDVVEILEKRHKS